MPISSRIFIPRLVTFIRIFEQFNVNVSVDYIDELITNAVKVVRYDYNIETVHTFNMTIDPPTLINLTGTDYVDSVTKFALRIALLHPLSIAHIVECRHDYIHDINTIYHEYLSNRHNHQDGYHITELYLQPDYTVILNDNPPVGLTFKPQAPYTDFPKGRVIYSLADDRLFIQLNGSHLSSRRMTCLRYLYSVYLFAQTGEIIPSDMDIDHVNDDRRDDRVDNAQPLDRTTNIIKYRINLGMQKIVVICPICGQHIHKVPEDTSLAKRSHRPHGRIVLCSSRCSMIYTLSIRRPSKYESLRRWIEKNQLYKFIRVWEDGRLEEGDIISTEMLNFNFMTQYGHLVNFESSLFLSKRERMQMFLDYKNQGLGHIEIGKLMGATSGSVKQWDKNMARIDYDISRLDELDIISHRSKLLYSRITELLDQGNNNYQVSQILHISPSTVLRVLRRFNDDRGSMTKHLEGIS